MSEIPATAQGQPKIASFAPELIDEILEHLFAALDSELQEREPAPSRGEYALVSQNWRGPVQRRLVRRLVIESGTQAKQVAEGLVKSGLDTYVRELKIRFADKLWKPYHSGINLDEPTSAEINAVDGVSRDDFLALLPLFPALTSLNLDGPPFAHFEGTEMSLLKASPMFPGLTSLSITTRRWHPDVELAHAVLCLTPSLRDLTLISDDNDDKNKIPSRRGPVTLPALRELELRGGLYPSSLVDLDLISLGTLAGITTLDWSDHLPDFDEANIGPIIRTMQSSLKRLYFACFQGIPDDFATDLERCTALEELYLLQLGGVVDLPSGFVEHFPRTVEKLSTYDPFVVHELVIHFTSRPPALKTIVLLGDFEESVGDGDDYQLELVEFKEIVEGLKDTGVELIVTGEGYLLALEEMKRVEEMD
ncbi:hypothetical protein RQP46_010899 [Phenoliferia psychrophenolica]